MSISGDVFADTHAQRASSRMLPVSSRTLLRLVVLLGATVAAVLLGATSASASDGSSSGLGGIVGHVVGKAGEVTKAPRETVTAPARRVVPKKAVAPRQQAAPRKAAPKPRKVDLVEPVSTTVAAAVEQTRSIAGDSIRKVAAAPTKQASRVVRKLAGDASRVTAPARRLIDGLGATEVLDATTDRASQVLAPVVPVPVGGGSTTSPVPHDVAVGSPARHRGSTSPDAVQLFGLDLAPATSFQAVAGPATDVAPQAPAGGPTAPTHVPTVPAQGPVAQGPGFTAGTLAVLDVLLWSDESGIFRQHTGDEPTPRSRAAAVDTRPA